MQLHSKQIDQQQGNPKAGHGLSDKRQKPDDIICNSIMVNCRKDAQRQRNDKHKQKRGTGQLYCIRKFPRQDFRNRLPIFNRIPKISMQHASQPVLILNRQRLIQPVFFLNFADYLRIAPRTHAFQHLLSRI